MVLDLFLPFLKSGFAIIRGAAQTRGLGASEKRGGTSSASLYHWLGHLPLTLGLIAPNY